MRTWILLGGPLNNFHQYTDCPTRDNKTLDLLYPMTLMHMMPYYRITWLTASLSTWDFRRTTMPAQAVRCFSNNKPWIISGDVKTLLNKTRRAFRSGDRQEQRRVQHGPPDMQGQLQLNTLWAQKITATRNRRTTPRVKRSVSIAWLLLLCTLFSFLLCPSYYHYYRSSFLTNASPREGSWGGWTWGDGDG